MPELPEVETVRRGLRGSILKQKLRKVEALCGKSFVGEGDLVVGAKVRDIRRFGKALVIDFDNQMSLMIHLRMTGQLIYDGKERYAAGHPSENFVAELPNKQTRVVLTFEKGVLYFNDQRKFGFIKVLKTAEIFEEPFIEKLAKEPWDMNSDEFYEALQRHKGAVIKAVILNQEVISGLGNIYADEALWTAGINPAKKAGSLGREQAASLLEAARAVMAKSIEAGGSTIRNYVKADGTRGNYLDMFVKVYHREGQACARCGGTIKKIKVAGRGTHFCPVCQND